jgi:hypothetical protein
MRSRSRLSYQQGDPDVHQELALRCLEIYNRAMSFHSSSSVCFTRHSSAPCQSQALGRPLDQLIADVQCEGFGLSQETSPSMFHSVSNNRALQKPHPYTAASGLGIGPYGALLPHRRTPPASSTAQFSFRHPPDLLMSHPSLGGCAASHAAHSRNPHSFVLLLC